jgi:predicted metal-dependent phosphoesterase TrpH
MLKFARNKVIGVARKDAETLSVHGVLDDDMYGVQVDVEVRIGDLELLSVQGKWNRYTTPECPGAIQVLQEVEGLHIDEDIANKLNKIVGRKGCRHFANLLNECCRAVHEAVKVVRWEDAKASNPTLTFEDFLRVEAVEGSKAQDTPARPSEPSVAGLSVPPSAQADRKEVQDVKRTRISVATPTDGFVVDLHVHTSPASPCSSAPEEALIQEAKRIGLSGICLTDHNHVWTPGRIAELSRKHAFPVFRGNEITTDQGDMLVFGFDKDIKGIITLQNLRKEVLEAGGFIVVAHPFRGFLTFGAEQLGLTTEKAAQRVLFQHVDAVEILNGKVTEKENRMASQVAEHLGLPVTGGSDAHEVADVGCYATRFPAEVRTERELIQALKSKTCMPVAFRSQEK